MARKKTHRRTDENAYKKTAAEKLSDVLELPPVMSAGVAHIDLMGNREAVVDGVKGVIEYDENIIRLNAGKFVLRFLGKDLEIRTLTDNQAIIAGFITSVEFVL